MGVWRQITNLTRQLIQGGHRRMEVACSQTGRRGGDGSGADEPPSSAAGDGRSGLERLRPGPHAAGLSAATLTAALQGRPVSLRMVQKIAVAIARTRAIPKAVELLQN